MLISLNRLSSYLTCFRCTLECLIRVFWWLLQNALTCANISIDCDRLCNFPAHTAGKKVAVSKDYTLELGFKGLWFQGRQDALVIKKEDWTATKVFCLR